MQLNTDFVNMLEAQFRECGIPDDDITPLLSYVFTSCAGEDSMMVVAAELLGIYAIVRDQNLPADAHSVVHTHMALRFRQLEITLGSVLADLFVPESEQLH